MSPIAIVATIEIKPEFRQEFLDYLNNGLITKSRAEAGNIQYDLHQSMDNENLFVVIENWSGAAAVEEHNASDHFQAFVAFVAGKLVSLDIKQLKIVS